MVVSEIQDKAKGHFVSPPISMELTNTHILRKICTREREGGSYVNDPTQTRLTCGQMQPREAWLVNIVINLRLESFKVKPVLK